MNPVLTIKSQVTIPKAIRQFLGIGPGERVKFEPMTDGWVALAPAQPRKRKTRTVDPFDAMLGSSTTKGTTESIMRLTRGDDWNQP